MAFWELSGESGASLGTTKVALDALGIPNAHLGLGSLETDTLTFSQIFGTYSDVSGADIDLGQIVELWRDGSRFFKGHCTGRRARDTTAGGLQIDTTVSGPWWWMEQTPMSGDLNDQTGESKERISYAFATGDLKTHIQTLLARAIALGVPIAEGSIADCFDIPQITLKQMSLADAMADLMRWIPDAAAWIDYSPATPTFNLVRRATATVATLTVGTPPCASIDVKPRFELETDQVVVTYVKRDVDGRTLYAEQISGHAGTAQAGGSDTIDLAADASESDDAYKGLEITIDSGTGSGQTRTIDAYDGENQRATVDTNWATNPDATSVYTIGAGNPGTGKRQIITVSGPELDSFLPNDLFDSFDGETALLTSVTDLPGIVVSLPPFAKAVEQGLLDTHLDVPATADIIFSYAGSTGTLPSRPNQYNLQAAAYLSAVDGTTVNPSGKYLLLGGTPPEWLREQLALEEVLLSGWWAWEFLYNNYYSGSNHFGTEPAWFYQLPNATLLHSGLTGTGHTQYKSWRLYGGQWETAGWMASSPVSGTIYRDADYAFIQPPEGLAASLQATQSFQPYEGEVGLAHEELGGTTYRGKVVNLNSSLTAHASMKALVQGVDLDTATGHSTLRLGTPARLNYAGLVNRFRRTASDNIVYL